jgi:hypothetical protein
LVFVQALVGRL